MTYVQKLILGLLVVCLLLTSCSTRSRISDERFFANDLKTETFIITIDPTVVRTVAPTPEPTLKPFDIRIQYLYSNLPSNRKKEDLDYIAKGIKLFMGDKDETYQILIGQIILEESKRQKKSIKKIVESLLHLEKEKINKIIPEEQCYFTAYKVIWGENVIPEPYTPREFMLITRIVHREFLGEPDEAKIAGTQIILNRKVCYKSTIEKVVFAKNQFTVASNKKRFWSFKPVKSDYICVLRALQGEKVVPDNTLYFHADVYGRKIWAKRWKTKYIGNIGKSCFYINTDYPSERDK